MFRCELCQCLVPLRTKACRLVLQTRPKTYPYRRKANRVVTFDHNGKRRVVDVDDPGGKGVEVVREVIVCPECGKHHG